MLSSARDQAPEYIHARSIWRRNLRYRRCQAYAAILQRTLNRVGRRVFPYYCFSKTVETLSPPFTIQCAHGPPEVGCADETELAEGLNREIWLSQYQGTAHWKASATIHYTIYMYRDQVRLGERHLTFYPKPAF